MRELSPLEQLMDAPGAPLINWREILKEIESEFPRAITSDHRAALLATFKAVMDILETTVAPEGLKEFQDARLTQYKTYIVQEALVGEDVCVETLHAVTEREIAAGRMAPDDGLRKTAEMGMFAPHLTRAELIAKAAAGSDVKPMSGWRRALAWVRGN